MFALIFALPCLLTAQSTPARLDLPAPGTEWVEALRDDEEPGNAAEAVAALEELGPAARPALAAGLGSRDWQQRFLCAYLLARGGPPDALLSPVCRTLIGHLADNSIRGDAQMAAAALVDLGARALPWLAAAERHADRQMAGILFMIRRDLGRRPVDRRSVPASREFLLALHGPAPARPPLTREPPTVAARIAELIEDLDQDGVADNGIAAMGELIRVHGRAAVPALRGALLHPDRQRRQFAAHCLMQLEAEPSHALWLACLEGLEHDEYAGLGATIYNAEESAAWFLKHPERGRSYLMQGVLSPDPIVRIRSALLLSALDDPDEGAYLPVLIARLADNDLAWDAVSCRAGLVEFGWRAEPWLTAALPHGDAQQQRMIHEALAAIRRPRQDGRVPLYRVAPNLGPAR